MSNTRSRAFAAARSGVEIASCFSSSRRSPRDGLMGDVTPRASVSLHPRHEPALSGICTVGASGGSAMEDEHVGNRRPVRVPLDAPKRGRGVRLVGNAEDPDRAVTVTELIVAALNEWEIASVHGCQTHVRNGTWLVFRPTQADRLEAVEKYTWSLRDDDVIVGREASRTVAMMDEKAGRSVERAYLPHPCWWYIHILRRRSTFRSRLKHGMARRHACAMHCTRFLWEPLKRAGVDVGPRLAFALQANRAVLRAHALVACSAAGRAGGRKGGIAAMAKRRREGTLFSHCSAAGRAGAAQGTVSIAGKAAFAKRMREGTQEAFCLSGGRGSIRQKRKAGTLASFTSAGGLAGGESKRASFPDAEFLRWTGDMIGAQHACVCVVCDSKAMRSFCWREHVQTTSHIRNREHFIMLRDAPDQLLHLLDEAAQSAAPPQVDSDVALPTGTFASNGSREYRCIACAMQPVGRWAVHVKAASHREKAATCRTLAKGLRERSRASPPSTETPR